MIGTNLALAGVTLIMILITATLFNQTVQENSDKIGGFFKRLFSPVDGLLRLAGGAMGALSSNGGGIAALMGPLVILGLTGLVYGFAEPGFGLNEKSAVLFVGLVAGVGGVTYTYSGGQALLSRRGYGINAGVKLFPIGLAVAVACVIISRVEDFQPGIIYGFIASFTVVGAASLDRRQTGQIVLIPGLLLLAVCVAAWLLIGPARELSEDCDGWLSAVPEGIAAALFVGGLEGLFFNMIPLQFMDGKKLWDWNKAAWVGMAGVTAFLFWHVLLNKEKAYFSALQQTTPLTALLIGGICLVLTLAVWLYFRMRTEAGKR